MHILYLGRKKDWIAKLESLVAQPIAPVETPFKAQSYIFENCFSNKGPIFIFIEPENAGMHAKRISQFKLNPISHVFTILIYPDIPQDLIPGYLSGNINEVIDIDNISGEGLQKILAILPRLKANAPREEKIQLFKLPAWKRIFDIIFTSAALVGLSPLFLLTALAIRLESNGPVIYTSQRVGSNYRIFGFLKFRSMHPDADQRLEEYKKLNQYQNSEQQEISEQEESEKNDKAILVGDDSHLTEEEYLKRRQKMKENNFVKLQNDPRVTRIGSFIRKYSIDELPQLINIIKGDMSIVGNRPLPLYEAELLTSDEYIERFMAPAGLTGLWQVEKRGMEGILSAEERKQLDIQYARRFSFLFDLRIIFRTFTAFIQRESV